MANANVNAGYRGIASLGTGGLVRFSDASITAKQTVEAPDLIMGDWDRDAYRYGPIEVGGSMSGPVTQNFATGQGGLFSWACTRNGTCGTLLSQDVTLYYYCGDGGGSSRTFTDMYINTLGFSCAAGDVAQFNIDFKGLTAGGWGTGAPPAYTVAEKLLTWDKVSVSLSGAGVPAQQLLYSSFDFNINNNIEPAYSLSQSNLFPVALVPGLRSIDGSLTVYNTPHFDGYDAWDDYTAGNVSTISFDIGGLAIDMKVAFHRVEPKSSSGLITSTVGFTGVTHQSGGAWG